MTTGIIESTATRLRFTQVVASDGEIAHQDRLSQRSGYFEIRAEVFLFVTSVTGNRGFHPGSVMPFVTSGYTGDGLRHNGLCRPGGREQLRVLTISGTHHFTLR